MHIVLPPCTTNLESNLTKQRQVFNLVFDGNHDHAASYSADCPEILYVHSHEYVASVLSGRRPNGFSDLDRRKALHAEASCSAMCAAALIAMRLPVDKAVVFAPVSGFHHAGYDKAGSYCTFNGLVAAASMLKRMNLVNKVLILDGDGHYGDGTDDIKDRLQLDWLLNWHIGRADPEGLKLWEDHLERQLMNGVSAVFYQAGADAHKDDPYMVGHLSTAEFMLRDRFVFETCRRLGVPVVWTLAGGYAGAQTLDLHTSTFESSVMVYAPGQMEQRRPIARGSTVAPLPTLEAPSRRPSDPDHQ